MSFSSRTRAHSAATYPSRTNNARIDSRGPDSFRRISTEMMLHVAVLLLVLLPKHLSVGYGHDSESSEATGDLDAKAPFGIPPNKFKEATSRPNSSAAYPIAGYDVSVPAGQDPSGNGNMIDGWRLSAAVAADVALTDADDVPEDNRSLFTDATTLSIYPPDGLEVDESWKMCAVVYTGVSGDVATSMAELDGTCEAVLQSDCIRQLQVAMTYGGTTKAGECSSPGIPIKCEGQFPNGVKGSAFGI